MKEASECLMMDLSWGMVPPPGPVANHMGGSLQNLHLRDEKNVVVRFVHELVDDSADRIATASHHF